MTRADKINRSILFFLLSISVFFLLDTYVLPLDTSKGVVITKTEQTISRLRVAIYRIQTQRTYLTVPASAYHKANVNDTIEVSRSFITHSVMKITVHKKEAVYSWRIGFVALGGFDFLVLLTVVDFLFLFFFYKRLPKMQMKRDIIIFLSFLSLLFFLFYFLFE